MDYAKEQEKQIGTQFANLRRSNLAQQDETARQAKMDLDRASNASGGFGGAETKMRQETIANIGQKFGQNQAEIGAQEAATRQQFAAGQQQMGIQQEQFNKQFQFAKDSFNREFKENQKTNIINALTAMHGTGIKTAKDWADWAKTVDFVGGNNPFSAKQREQAQRPQITLPMRNV